MKDYWYGSNAYIRYVERNILILLSWKMIQWRKMLPRRTDNERRARVHLTKKRAHVHARACNVHVVPINVLIIFSYHKFK